MTRGKKKKNSNSFFYPLLFVITIIVCIYFLIPGFKSVANRKKFIETLKQRNREKQLTIEQLKLEIKNMDSDQSIEKVARDELHLVKPGEVIFILEPEKKKRDRR